MVNARLIIAGLIVIIALTMSIQTSFSSAQTLDLTLYSDGSAHVSAYLDTDPLKPNFEFNLFGPSVDNFVAVDKDGLSLYSEIVYNKATIDTFGSSALVVDYDIHDLISKEGRVWTFSLDSPTDYSLLMPSNSIIIGMNAPPSHTELKNDQIRLELSDGLSEITYIFSTTNLPTDTTEQLPADISTLVLILVSIIAVISGAIILIKRKQVKSSSVSQTRDTFEPKTDSNLTDTTTAIFNLRPEMREDDKEIIKFISENGGQALESELRKKFLQPRTTMWRAVKRLERLGVIEISKKDLQNLVKLKEDLEEDEE